MDPQLKVSPVSRSDVEVREEGVFVDMKTPHAPVNLPGRIFSFFASFRERKTFRFEGTFIPQENVQTFQ